MSFAITLAFFNRSGQRRLLTAKSNELISIGSKEECSIVLGRYVAEPVHCQVRYSKTYKKWIVEDLSTYSGTFLNSTKITRARPLANDDRIRLGASGPIVSVGIYNGTGKDERENGIFSSALPLLFASRATWLGLGASLSVISAIFVLGLVRINQQSVNTRVRISQPTPESTENDQVSSSGSNVCAGNRLDPSTLYRKLKATSALITTSKGGLGSGVIIYSDKDRSYVLTNSHVVIGEDSPQVYFPEKDALKGKIVTRGAADKLREDLALIRVDKGGLPVAMIKDRINVGQTTFVIGSPGLGSNTKGVLAWSLTRGIVSNIDPAGEPGIFQTDAGINPGNSGGPIFDDEGCLIGLAVGVPSDRSVQQVGFAISAGSIKSFLGW